VPLLGQDPHWNDISEGNYVGISPPADHKRSDWPAAEAVRRHVKFSQRKIRPCDAAFDQLFTWMWLGTRSLTEPWKPERAVAVSYEEEKAWRTELLVEDFFEGDLAHFLEVLLHHTSNAVHTRTSANTSVE